jgi:hypothetical protein
MSGPILDVVGKPEGMLVLVGEEPYNGTTARKYFAEDERVYWRVIDSLGNEIWYTERKQAGI